MVQPRPRGYAGISAGDNRGTQRSSLELGRVYGAKWRVEFDVLVVSATEINRANNKWYFSRPGHRNAYTGLEVGVYARAGDGGQGQ